ncbi:MAG: hypothetical protein ACOX4G_09840 [Limnochordia bacterium]
MASLHYDISVRIEPENPVPGGWVDVVAELRNVTGEIRSVQVSIAEHDYFLTLQPRGENTFTTRAFVPWEADPGQYVATVWGVSTSGDPGPRLRVPVHVKAR